MRLLWLLDPFIALVQRWTELDSLLFEWPSGCVITPQTRMYTSLDWLGLKDIKVDDRRVKKKKRSDVNGAGDSRSMHRHCVKKKKKKKRSRYFLDVQLEEEEKDKWPVVWLLMVFFLSLFLCLFLHFQIIIKWTWRRVFSTEEEDEQLHFVVQSQCAMCY